jgi:hypothetical protein
VVGGGAATGASPVRGGARSLTEELDEDQTLEDAEESPAGTGWSNMGGGGDEHIGQEGRTGGADWDEDWGGGGDLVEDEEDKTPYEEKSEEEEEEE